MNIIKLSSLFGKTLTITNELHIKLMSNKKSSSVVTCSVSLPAALLFDCDGVLVDTERDGHRVSFNDTFTEVCFSLYFLPF